MRDGLQRGTNHCNRGFRVRFRGRLDHDPGHLDDAALARRELVADYRALSAQDVKDLDNVAAKQTWVAAGSDDAVHGSHPRLSEPVSRADVLIKNARILW